MSPNGKRKWPARLRRLVQLMCFLAFVGYVIYVPVIATRELSSYGVMRLSPLAGAGAMLSAWRIMMIFVPAFVLLLGAVFLGRYFCGWMCPLGGTVDVVDWCLEKLGFRLSDNDASVSPEENLLARASWHRRLKYYILIACVFSAFLGLSLFAYFDPLSIAVRSYVLAVHPLLLRTLLPLLGFLRHIPFVGIVAGEAADGLREALLGNAEIYFVLQVVTALTFLGVVGLSVFGRRMWCRSVCPLGALYGLAALKSFTGRKVTDACIECGRCTSVCPTHCISANGHRTLAGECILCMRCQEECPVDAIRFLGSDRGQIDEIDLTRRGTVAALGSVAVAYPLIKTSTSESVTKGGSFIRPPLAAQDMDEFLQECLRCGQCMRACPTQAIQPVGLGGGLESLWTPQIVPRLGYCEYDCKRCGQVCPTDAIPEFSLDEKHASAIGLAFVDRTRCIPWRGLEYQQEDEVDWDTHNCGVCEEVCPVDGKAIHFRRHDMDNGQELRTPYVRSELCVGCGFCENVCPIQGDAAIRVTGGHRNIEPPEDGGETESAIVAALPTTIGDWRLTGEKNVYKTGNELWDWINGAADPYRKFHFTVAGNAMYARDGDKAEIIIWEFEHSDDAFGVYGLFRDADSDRLDFGDHVSVAEGPILWGWEGKWYVTVQPLAGDVSRKDVVSLGRSVVEQLDAEESQIPEICRMLPESGMNAGTMRFMRHKLHLDDLYLPAAVNESVDLEGPTVAAYAEYSGKDSGGESSMLLVRYANPEDAQNAMQAYEEAWEELDATVGRENDVLLVEMDDSTYSAANEEDRMLAITLGMDDAEKAVDMVRRVTKDENVGKSGGSNDTSY
ncbi:MAG: DUF6599 family protein [Planctomycetota bacterium]